MSRSHSWAPFRGTLLLGIPLSIVACNAAGGEGSSAEGGPQEACLVEEVASGLAIPYGLLVEEDGNYLVTVDGEIIRVFEDGMLESLVQTSENSASGMIYHEQAVLMLDNTGESLVRYDAQWSATTVATGLGDPVSIVLDGNNYIVTDFAEAMTPGEDGRLLRVTSAGVVEEIASAGLGAAAGVALADDGYYVTDFISGRLLHVARTGEVDVVAEGLGNPVDIKRRDDLLYIADFAGGSAGGRILMVSTSDHSVTTLDVSGLGSASGLALDGPDIVVADISGGKIFRVNNCIEE